jgi:hypothetical protein
MSRTPILYAQFDGEDVDGKRYALGDPLDADINPGVRTYLVSAGRFASTNPIATAAPTGASLSDMPVEDMTRAELESAAIAAMTARAAEASEEDLKRAITAHREMLADRAGEGQPFTPSSGDAMPGTTPPASDPVTPEAKPLKSQTTAELEATAQAEEITFGEDVKTNADRVKAIEDARAAKAGN